MSGTKNAIESALEERNCRSVRHLENETGHETDDGEDASGAAAGPQSEAARCRGRGWCGGAGSGARGAGGGGTRGRGAGRASGAVGGGSAVSAGLRRLLERIERLGGVGVRVYGEHHTALAVVDGARGSRDEQSSGIGDMNGDIPLLTAVEPQTTDGDDVSQDNSG